MEQATFNDFKKIKIMVGTIEEAVNVEGSEKLLKLTVNFGDFKRTIVSGIAKWYSPNDLINKQVPFIVNLEPKKIMGIESQGMILAVDNNGEAVLLNPQKLVQTGSLCI